MKLIKGIVLILLLLLTAACDGGAVCTNAGCFDTYVLVFNAEDDSLSLGEYEVQLRQEEAYLVSCSFRLKQTGPACSNMDCIDNRSCDSYGMQDPFSEGVYYLHAEEQLHLYYPRLEGELRITINQNGSILAGLITEPLYEINQPNGPDCEPTCFNARTELTVNRE